MNKKLFDKIRTYLQKGDSVLVEFCPHHKGCDVYIKKEDYLNDYDFFDEQFGEWWYEDGGLLEELGAYDAYSESVEVEFFLDKEKIISKLVLYSSDYHSGDYYDRHRKEEILTDKVVSSIKKFLNFNEIDREMIFLDFSYNEGILSDTQFSYDDKTFNLSELHNAEDLKSEMSDILSGWCGPFYGTNYDDFKSSISIELGDENFVCTDIVEYSFEIESSE